MFFFFLALSHLRNIRYAITRRAWLYEKCTKMVFFNVLDHIFLKSSYYEFCRFILLMIFDVMISLDNKLFSRSYVIRIVSRLCIYILNIRTVNK